MLSKIIQEKLNGLIQNIQDNEANAQVLGSTTLIGLASRRIFNEQTGSENAEQEKLGAYSTDYLIAKQKKYKGRNELFVNLYASGTLYGATKVVKKGEDTYVAVTDVKYPNGTSTVEVSNYLDKQYGEVFAPTQTEIKAVIKVVDKYLFDKGNEGLSE